MGDNLNTYFKKDLSGIIHNKFIQNSVLSYNHYIQVVRDSFVELAVLKFYCVINKP